MVPEVHVTIQNIAPEPLKASPSTMATPTNEVHDSSGEVTQPYSHRPIEYPPTADVIELAEKERPGKGFHLLLEDLLDAGLLTSADILILEESALTVIGRMGWPHARALRNFSKRLTLPLLGMRGLQWLEPEFGELPDLALARIKTELKAPSPIKKEDSMFRVQCYDSNSPDIIEVSDSEEDGEGEEDKGEEDKDKAFGRL